MSSHLLVNLKMATLSVKSVGYSLLKKKNNYILVDMKLAGTLPRKKN